MLFRATVLPCSNLRSPLCSARARLALAVGAHPVPMPSAAASARRRKREMLSSKDVFTPKLDDTPITGAENATHVLRRRQAGGWVTEVRAIWSVEGFEAELQSAPTVRENEVLVQAEVNANGTRP